MEKVWRRTEEVQIWYMPTPIADAHLKHFLPKERMVRTHHRIPMRIT